MTPPLTLLYALSAFAAEPAPAVHSVGFLGRPGGLCEDRAAARRGRCLDVVDFVDLERAWGVRAPRLVDQAAWRALSRLYAHAWEDVAYRWTAPDIEQTLKSAGFTALPTNAEAWKQSEVQRGAWALPARDTWLGAGSWLDPLATPGAERNPRAFFPHVRYHGPDGQQELPRTVLLSGRFASRLGFDGRRHDYDIMDGDPASSGPFFEQMFPYHRELGARGKAGDGVYDASEREPLAAFRFPRHLHDSTPDAQEAIRAFDEALAGITSDPGIPAARELASDHFNQFVRVVYVQAGQYAMEDFTRNQMRVLTALTAMATPPQSVDGDAGIARDLVAAARGETDTSAEIVAHFDEGALRGVPSGVHVRYEQLPFAVVEPWVASLAGDRPLDSGFYANLDADLSALLPTMLREERRDFTSLERAARRDWLREALLPGNDREEVDAEILRIALARLLQASEPDFRERVETWMLIDQARLAIAATFDSARVATPNEIVEASTAQWQQVLALHGYPTQILPQGLGAVDPTAICTLQDGLEGLDEASFRPVTVDLLTSAPAGADADGVLAGAVGRVPFVMVDDPSTNPPTVEPLVELGDGTVLYRVRWSLWSGWHALWDLAPATEGRSRLMLRTAAFCEDTVLTDPTLAPTVIRAGLLAGNFRPTVPERGGLPAIDAKPTDPEALGASVPKAPDEALAAAEKAKALKEKLAPPAVEDLSGLTPKVGSNAFELVQEELRPEVTYLQGLAQTPLERRLSASGGLLFVADVGAPGEGRALHDRVPRTPYTRVRGRVTGEDAAGDRVPRDERKLTAAGWMWFVVPGKRPVQVSPAYAPKDSVSGDRVPRWSRRKTTDYALTVGGSAFPWRAVDFDCGAVLPGVATDCAPGQTTGTVLSEGFAADMQALGTWWFTDRPRLGIDAGVEARLDLRHGGTSWFWDELNDGTRFTWALRPAAGIVAGLHFAPRPSPLWTGRSTSATWGAPRSDGRAKLGRVQGGLRGSLLAGPGFNGLEGTVGAEAWLGWSVRRARGPHASFTPYHPRVVAGPFVRGQLGIPLTDGTDPARFLLLEQSTTILVGVRTHLRLAAPAKPPPEVE